MSTAFPLLSLPHLAFEHVHQYFKIPELINLSQCSERVKTVAKSFATPRKGTVLEVQVSEICATIKVQRKNRDRFVWRISLKRDFVLADIGELTEKRIAGANWKVMEALDGLLTTPEEGRFEEDILFVVNLVRDLLKCEITTLDLCFDTNCNFDKLLVASDTLHRAKRIEISPTAFTHSEMTFLLDNFVTDNLRMGGFAGPDFIYDKPLNYPIIHVPEASWITGNKLLEMSDTCGKIDLESAYLISNDDLNQLVKRWLSSTNRTLEVMNIRTTPSQTSSSLPSCPIPHNLELQKILNGVPTFPGTKKREDASKHYHEYIQYELGIDVRRADGMMATIMLHERWNSSFYFFFIVWNNPDLNLSE